jgi:hypothetical protein
MALPPSRHALKPAAGLVESGERDATNSKMRVELAKPV